MIECETGSFAIKVMMHLISAAWDIAAISRVRAQCRAGNAISECLVITDCNILAHPERERKRDLISLQSEIG